MGRPPSTMTLALSTALDDALDEVGTLLVQWTSTPEERELDIDAIRDAAVRISLWVQRLASESESVAIVCDRLVTLAEPFFNEKTITTSHNAVPSTRDKRVTIDDVRENTPQFWILECLASIVDGAPPTQISESVLSFLFARLTSAYSVAMRAAACRCISAVSSMHLRELVNLVLQRLRACRGNVRLREYAIVQKAVGGFAFSFQGTLFDITTYYLNELSQLALKIERGVLRAEVCASLRQVFIRLLGSEERSVLENCHLQRSFWQAFARIYQIVSKWSKKSKHVLFCYNLMVTMVCYGEKDFFFSDNREDVLRHVVLGLKKDDIRAACFELIRNYIRDVDPAFFRDDMEAFTTQMRFIVSNVMPRKRSFIDTELAIIESILVEIGRKHVHFLITEVAVEMLKPKGNFSGAHKALTFRALAKVAHDLPVETASYSYTLGPLVAAVIESKDADPSVMCAALSCFPSIRDPKNDRARATGFVIAGLTLHSNHAIGVSASGSLHQFAIRMPEMDLVFCLFSLVDVLSDMHSIELDVGIRALNNVKVILITYDEYLQRNPNTKLIPFDEWLAILQHLEGTVLLWLCHPESWVRREAFSLLGLFKSKGLRRLERRQTSGKNLCVLADYLSPDERADPSAHSCSELDELIRCHYDKFEGVIIWAWSTTLQHAAALEKELTQESFMLWRNQFRLLCLACRPGLHAETGFTTEKYRSEYSAHRLSLQSLRQSFVHLNMSAAEVISFSSMLFTLVRHPSQHVRHDVIGNIAIMHHSVFDRVASQLKLHVFSSPPSSKKKKMARLDPKMDFFFNTSIVRVYEQMLLSLNKVSFSSLTVLPLHIADFVSQWVSPSNKSLLKQSSTSFRLSVSRILYCYFQFWTHISECLQSPTVLTSSPSMDEALEAPASPRRRGIRSLTSLSASPSSPRSPALLSASIGSASSPKARVNVRQDAQLRRRESLLQFICAVVLPSSGTVAESKLDIELETAAINALGSLAAVAPLNDSNLEQYFVSFLTEMIKRSGSRLSTCSAVVDALTSFLNSHRHWTSMFIMRAARSIGRDPQLHHQTPKEQPQQQQEPTKEHQAEVPILVNDTADVNSEPNSATTSNAFLEALVCNVESEPEMWLPSAEDDKSVLTSSALPPSTELSSMPSSTPGTVQTCRLLVACLLLQGSESPVSRGLALRLAVQLRIRFDPGYEISTLVHPSVDISFSAALKHSSAVARIGCSQLPSVVEAVAEFVQSVSLSDTALLLRLLRPWISHFGTFLLSTKPSPSDEDLEVAAWPILRTLFNLTRSLDTTPLLDAAVCDLWQAMSDCDEVTPASPPRNVLLRHRHSFNSAAPSAPSSVPSSPGARAVVSAVINFLLFNFSEASFEQLVCQRIAQYIFRSCLCSLFVDGLIVRLPRLQPCCVLDVDDLRDSIAELQFSKPASKSQPLQISNAVACLSMLCDMVFERPALFRPHYALLLQSAVVLRAAVAPQLLAFVAADLGFDLGLHKSDDESDTLKGAFKSFAAVLNCDKSQWKLGRDWSRVALSWCMKGDDEIARRSLIVLRQLHTPYEPAVVFHLCSLVRSSLALCNDADLSMHIDTLCCLKRQRDKQQGLNYVLPLAVGLSLLSHGSAHVYGLGLRLTRRMLSISADIASVASVLSFSSNAEEEPGEKASASSGLARLLLRGLTHTPSFPRVVRLTREILRLPGMTDSCDLFSIMVLALLLSLSVEFDTHRELLSTELIDAAFVLVCGVHAPAAATFGRLRQVVSAVRFGHPLEKSSKSQCQPLSRFSIDSRNDDRSRCSSIRLSRRGTLLPQQASISNFGSSTTPPMPSIPRHSSILSTDVQLALASTVSPAVPIEDLTMLGSDEESGIEGEELVAEVPELMRQMLQELTTVFPSMPALLIRFVQTLLQYGEIAWRKPCLWIIEALLDTFDCDIDQALFTQLSEVLVVNCFAFDEDTMIASEVICLRLLENAPKSYRSGNYRFVRPKVFQNREPLLNDVTTHWNSAESSVAEAVFDGAVMPLLESLASDYNTSQQRLDISDEIDYIIDDESEPEDDACDSIVPAFYQVASIQPQLSGRERQKNLDIRSTAYLERPQHAIDVGVDEVSETNNDEKSAEFSSLNESCDGDVPVDRGSVDKLPKLQHQDEFRDEKESVELDE